MPTSEQPNTTQQTLVKNSKVGKNPELSVDITAHNYPEEKLQPIISQAQGFPLLQLLILKSSHFGQLVLLPSAQTYPCYSYQGNLKVCYCLFSTDCCHGQNKKELL